MRPSDDRRAALERSGEFADGRVTYLWDENFAAGRAWQKTLGLSGAAWDVYFLYQPDAKWKSRLPKPDFWMHQLWAAEGKAPFLDEEALGNEARRLLGRTK